MSRVTDVRTLFLHGTACPHASIEWPVFSIVIEEVERLLSILIDTY
jgi:hypothetical protein